MTSKKASQTHNTNKMTQKFEILPATAADAPYISLAIRQAIGDEIFLAMAGSEDRLPLVDKAFENLASGDCAQYSYKNALVARTESGDVGGVVICYDGDRLHTLRQAFVDEANKTLGFNITNEDFTDETTPDENYIDTLCVFEPYRRQGLATKLIDAAERKLGTPGKKLGLLVDPDNPTARALYQKIGFRDDGFRPFASVMMHHMVR